MGLDKWIGSEEPKQKPKKTEKKTKPLIEDSIKSEKKKLEKYHLVCSKSNCKYQRVLMKRELDPRDLICPKCRSSMKIK